MENFLGIIFHTMRGLAVMLTISNCSFIRELNVLAILVSNGLSRNVPPFFPIVLQFFPFIKCWVINNQTYIGFQCKTFIIQIAILIFIWADFTYKRISDYSVLSNKVQLYLCLKNSKQERVLFQFQGFLHY